MGMSRERKVLCGLAAVAGAGLMFDMAFLAPSGAAAAPAQADQAAVAAPMQSAAAAAATRLENGVRDAMQRKLVGHAPEAMPHLAFGPDPLWTVAEVSGPALQAAPAPTPAASVMIGVLPGLNHTPALSLVMPTREGGVAVIDGHRIQVGQTHPDGYTLAAVQARSVTVIKDGISATLSLPSPGN